MCSMLSKLWAHLKNDILTDFQKVQFAVVLPPPSPYIFKKMLTKKSYLKVPPNDSPFQ